MRLQIISLQIFLSKDPDANVFPSGWNLAEKISAPCPDSNMIGARRLDVRGGPCKGQLMNNKSKDNSFHTPISSFLWACKQVDSVYFKTIIGTSCYSVIPPPPTLCD